MTIRRIEPGRWECDALPGKEYLTKEEAECAARAAEDAQIHGELVQALREIAGDAEFASEQSSKVFSPKRQLREIAMRARAVLAKIEKGETP